MSESDNDERITYRLDEMNGYLFRIVELLEKLTEPQVVIETPFTAATRNDKKVCRDCGESWAGVHICGTQDGKKKDKQA